MLPYASGAPSGKMTPEELAARYGATYWRSERFWADVHAGAVAGFQVITAAPLGGRGRPPYAAWAREEGGSGMAVQIKVTISEFQAFEPDAVDLDGAKFALAQMVSLKQGYTGAGLDVPDWLSRKIRLTKRNLADRQRDADAAELARLKAEREKLIRQKDPLADVEARIAALEAKSGPAADAE